MDIEQSILTIFLVAFILLFCIAIVANKKVK